MTATAHRDERARLLRLATNASVATALALAAAKLVAFFLTGSIAVLASLIDSGLDAGASVLNALAVRYSQKPADEDHRFGHGKSEALAGLGQAVFIAASAALLVVHAIERLRHPKPLVAIEGGVAVISFSLAATLVLVSFQRHVVRRTDSSVIKADALHFVSDVVSYVATLAALVLAAHGFPRLDPLFGLAIAAMTLYGAAHIGKDTFEILMDRELAPEVQERIRTIALAHEEVSGVHDLRTRKSGSTTLIQLHLEMDGQITLDDAHRISNEVERAILEAIPDADVTIHEDPAGVNEPRQFR